MKRTRTALAIACFAVLLLCQAGCIYTTHHNVERTGALVAPQVVESIELGKTTRAQLVLMLGEPTSARQDGDAELLTYSSAVIETRRKCLLFLYTSQANTTTITAHTFTIAGGVVTDVKRVER